MVEQGTTFELALPGWDPEGPRRAQLAAGLRSAIREGWLRGGAPPPLLAAAGELVAPVVIGRSVADSGGPRIEERALAELFSSGAFERHLRKARQRCRAKRALLLEELAAALPMARVLGAAAGLHAMLELPDGCEERAVVGSCAAAGVHVQGLADFTRVHRRGPALILDYGLPSERQLREAVAAIAAAVDAGSASA
jgi:GntR family transcriptional regulator/MocR family aminotransferase